MNIDPFFYVIFLEVIVIFLGTLSLILLRKKRNREYSDSTFEALWEIEKVVLETVDFEQATQKVVNIILSQLGFLNLGYEVIVLTLLDREKKELRRIAISRTDSAGEFLKASPIPFENIVIPLSAKSNLSVRAIHEKKSFTTGQVADVLYPALKKEWVNGFQKYLGIKTAIVYPVKAKEKILGTIIFSLNKEEKKISESELGILESFVGAVGIALDNALLFKSLSVTTENFKNANRRLKELDKLKDEFVSLVSHELRTPMTVIRSYVDMLLHQKAVGELNEKQRDYLERVNASALRLSNLVNEMLDISRIESGRIALDKKDFDISTLIKSTIEELRLNAEGKGISLSFDSKVKNAPIINADEDRLKEVLINYLGNGIKYNKSGGRVRVHIKEEGDEIVVEVQDDGIGIKKENLDELFKKFSTLSRKFAQTHHVQSTGLGLYLSKSIIELHGGKVWAESEGIGKGSSFYFSIKKAK